MPTISIFEPVAADVASTFASLDPSDDIRIDLSSEAGDWFGSMTAYNVLAARKGQVTTQNMGIVAGGAVLVFMAGRKRIMPANAMIVLQDPWGVAQGESDEIIAQGEAMMELRDNIAKLIAGRSKLKEAEVRALMAKETWLDADAAFMAGIATEVVEPTKMAASFDRSRFRNVPSAEVLDHQSIEARWKAVEARAWRKWNAPRVITGGKS